MRIICLLLAFFLFCWLIYLIGEQWMLPCLFHKFTGWDCPLCGGQRMLRALLHSDFRAAFRYNPFLLCSLPLFMLWATAYLWPKSVKSIPLLSKLCTDRIFFIYLFVSLLWGIIRNL
ncbi:MAG: DUF2752 domain-containing protein [Mediterranea massiliensis]|nr:DUF2752 domain-containing protein [Mediterranea massiliensis]